MKRLLGFLFFCVLLSQFSFAQEDTKKKTIQFSGVVVTEDEGEVVPLPYTNIGVVGTSRGTVSDRYGFFSLAAREGEEILFTHLGFKDVSYVIPDTLTGTLYSVFQIMTEDTILLPETVIYPWPSKEHFEIEFLAMEVEQPYQHNAEENLSQQILNEIAAELPVDGTEASKINIASQAESFKYEGQYKPQNIFNPLAWKKFIEAWKRGDFKRKE